MNSSRKTNRKVYPRNYGPVHTTNPDRQKPHFLVNLIRTGFQWSTRGIGESGEMFGERIHWFRVDAHTHIHTQNMRFQKTPDSCERGLCIILLNTNDDYFSFIDFRLPLMDAVSSFTWSVQSNTKQLTEFGLDPLSQQWSSAILIQ